MSRLIESGVSDGVGFGDADETDAPLNVAGEFNVAGTLNLEQALNVSGTVFDESQTPVEDATVALTLQSGGTSVAYTTTDANGDYEFTNHPDADGTEQLFHVAVYDDEAPIFNAFSKPFVSTTFLSGGA